ncbi:hypothetical protein FORC64_3361 [Escherichia coli]|uniref:hypothetical protein n=1 Tax=Escherichia coli TaxID=562 RepID=UPI000E109AB2|nr:hypothetical protein [Escherichia coli]AXI36258.1 hypothetical protein FORC64_3361 [Escherichia coli]RDQ91026.1 Lysis protein S [Escherichia coli]
MYQMEKITTGVSYTTSAVGTGYRKQRAALFTRSFTTWALAISEHRRFFVK